MLKLNTILHPTDFSQASDYAMRLACSLAIDHDASLTVLHVEPAMVYTDLPLAFDRLDEARYRESIWDLFRQVQHTDPRLRDLCFEAVVRQGDPATEIVELAVETAADLIVMGTHGRTGLARILVGSVSEQVMRTAPCPVLTVKTTTAADRVVEEQVAWISE